MASVRDKSTYQSRVNQSDLTEGVSVQCIDTQHMHYHSIHQDGRVVNKMPNRMERNGMERNGMDWNGMEWNRMEWNGMEWNGKS